MLTIPTPTLEFDALAPGLAAREKPLTINLGAVERDGIALGFADLAIGGLHAFRRLAPGAPTEVWNKDAAAWVPHPAPDLSALAVEALAFRPGDALPWQGILVPAGGLTPPARRSSPTARAASRRTPSVRASSRTTG